MGREATTDGGQEAAREERRALAEQLAVEVEKAAKRRDHHKLSTFVERFA